MEEVISSIERGKQRFERLAISLMFVMVAVSLTALPVVLQAGADDRGTAETEVAAGILLAQSSTDDLLVDEDIHDIAVTECKLSDLVLVGFDKRPREDAVRLAGRTAAHVETNIDQALGIGGHRLPLDVLEILGARITFAVDIRNR